MMDGAPGRSQGEPTPINSMSDSHAEERRSTDPLPVDAGKLVGVVSRGAALFSGHVILSDSREGVAGIEVALIFPVGERGFSRHVTVTDESGAWSFQVDDDTARIQAFAIRPTECPDCFDFDRAEPPNPSPGSHATAPMHGITFYLRRRD
jgi:hypothetical protein